MSSNATGLAVWQTITAISGVGDITDVLPGNGISVTNQGGPQPSVAINTADISTCVNAGQKILWNSVNNRFACGIDQGGTITDGTINGQTLRWDQIQNIWTANINRFNDNTNVGIGTATPTAKLEVAGNTKITGNTNIIGNPSIAGTVTIVDSSLNFYQAASLNTSAQ